MSSSDISMVPESTLPDTSSEVKERELEQRERPEVHVPATQAARVTDRRWEDEVHDICDDVRRLETRFDGLEERFDGLEERMDESDRRIDGRFDTIKEWTEEMKVWTLGVADTLKVILEKLSDIDSRVGPAVKKAIE